MIESHSGSIFDVKADAIVNPVNCVGVMGAGLAEQFKARYPLNFENYAEACKQHRVRPGVPFIHDTRQAAPRYIVNLPTKVHWSKDSDVMIVHRSLLGMLRWMRQEKIQSVAMPKIGCGLGHLDWQKTVRPLIVRIFGTFPAKVILLE